MQVGSVYPDTKVDTGAVMRLQRLMVDTFVQLPCVSPLKEQRPAPEATVEFVQKYGLPMEIGDPES
jgi:hypothetical protein